MCAKVRQDKHGKDSVEHANTYTGVGEFDKCIAPRFAFHGTGFVEQEVQLGDFAVLGEYLEQRVSVVSVSRQIRPGGM